MRYLSFRRAIAAAILLIVAIVAKNAVVFSVATAVRHVPDEVVALANKDKRTIYVQVVSSGEVLGEFPLDAHSAIAYCPATKALASCGREHITIWDLTTGNERATIPAYGWCLAFSPDGRVLASADMSGVKLWDAATGQELVCDNASWEGEDDDYCHYLAFSPDGTFLAARNDERIAFWHVTSGKYLASCDRLWYVGPPASFLLVAILSLAAIVLERRWPGICKACLRELVYTEWLTFQRTAYTTLACLMILWIAFCYLLWFQ